MDHEEIMGAAPAARIASVDLFRTFAVFAVILLHTDLSGALRDLQAAEDHPRLFGIALFLLDRLLTCAIPFFFLFAGYFFRKKMLEGRQLAALYTSYVRRIAAAWLFWWLCYFLVPSPENLTAALKYGYDAYLQFQYDSLQANRIRLFLLVGSANHLWFMPALACSVSLMAFCYRIKAARLVLPVASILLLIQILGTTYAGTEAGSVVSGYLQPLYSVAEGIPITGYCLAFFFVALGWRLAEQPVALNPVQACGTIVLGFCISLLERALFQAANANATDQDLGVILIVVGVALFALAMPSMGQNRRISGFGKYTLGIYASHYLIILYIDPIKALPYPVNHVVYPIAAYLLSLGLTVLLTKFRWLRRVAA